jgi:uncharacterized oxidoreductase
MQMTGNTILVTGGGGGIGRGLAEAFHRRGNRVIVVGRRPEPLAATIAANPGMQSAILDVASAEAIRDFAGRVKRDFPALNVVVHNAGIMRLEMLSDGKVEDAEATVATNLLGPIRLTAALLNGLLRQPRATIVTVTSGLAFMPLALTPTYCATKAAIHSYSQSLRYQLKETGVRVIELAPPYVQTELMGPGQAVDPRGMPLADFIAEAMRLFETSPEAEEILVERVKPHRQAEASGEYSARYKAYNDSRFQSYAEMIAAAPPNGRA